MYGVPVITHCPLETHGSLHFLEAEDKLLAYISTQAVSDVGAGFAQPLKLPAACPCLSRITWAGIRQQVHDRPLGRRRRRPRKESRQACAHGARARRGADGRRSSPVNFRQGESRSQEGRHVAGMGDLSWGTGGLTGGGASPVPYGMADSESPEALLGRDKHRCCQGMARSNHSARMLYHHGRAGRSGRDAEDGSAGIFSSKNIEMTLPRRPL